MKNLVVKKFIFEIFNADKYICSVLATNLRDAIKQAKKKVSFDFNVVETFHCIN